MTGWTLLEDVGEGEELPGFDIDNPELPEQIAENALASGGYPYEKQMKRKAYEAELLQLQIELLKLQRWVQEEGKRLVILFEGRDAAGKDGSISCFTRHLNPRHARAVALPKPTETEQGEWYFQRYVAELPSAGNMLLFNRSWYNRAVVEPVMGYCTEVQYRRFLEAAPHFEEGLVADGVLLFKLWLSIGREMQLQRFHARRHDVLKRWKLTENDVRALTKFDAFTAARDEMFRRTSTEMSPWFAVRANDKRRARINAIRLVLSKISYPGKDERVAAAPDPDIVLPGPALIGRS